MRALVAAAFLVLACARTPAPVARTPDDCPPGPDARPRPGVPRGGILTRSLTTSTIFPGTQRDYWIYVPAQYRPDRPACVYVQQDGIRFEAPAVFDNLIH